MEAKNSGIGVSDIKHLELFDKKYYLKTGYSSFS